MVGHIAVGQKLKRAGGRGVAETSIGLGDDARISETVAAGKRGERKEIASAVQVARLAGRDHAPIVHVQGAAIRLPVAAAARRHR